MTLSSAVEPFTAKLAWALIHFVWQGALVAFALKLVLSLPRLQTARVRYLLACGAMVCLAAAPVWTFLNTQAGEAPAMAARSGEAVVSPAEAPGALLNEGLPPVIVRVFIGHGGILAVVRQWVDGHVSTVLLIWLTGVLLFSFRLGAAWLTARGLARGGVPLAGAEWLGRLAFVSARLRVARPVKLLQSALVEVPTVLGWLRPVVLLPASTLSGLTPAQLESILAHELAHVRRCDYLVNLGQCLVETLLFYHPAVWWVSAQVRVERENCCDDLAVASCGDPGLYVEALATLETLRDGPAMGMAATGGTLVSRVRRLLGQPPKGGGSQAWIAAVILGMAVLVWSAAQRTAVAEPERPAEALLRLENAPGGAAIPASIEEPTVESLRRELATAQAQFTELQTRYKSRHPLYARAEERIAALEKSIRDQTRQSHATPQVQIDIKFIEMSDADLGAMGFDAILKSIASDSGILVTNRIGRLRVPANATHGISLFGEDMLRGDQRVTKGTMGVLTDAQRRVLLRAIEQRSGVDVLSSPRITTFSGRQARVEIGEIRNIVTGVTRGKTNVFGTTAIPVGVSVDVIPYASGPDDPIQMTLIPGMTDFLGYDDPGPFQPADANGLVVQEPLPRFRACQTITSARVANGETLVLTGFESAGKPGKGASASPPKPLIILVTPTLMDASGNRLPPK